MVHSQFKYLINIIVQILLIKFFHYFYCRFILILIKKETCIYFIYCYILSIWFEKKIVGFNFFIFFVIHTPNCVEPFKCTYLLSK